MAAISGYDLTLVGASLGSFAGAGSVVVGGLEVDVAEYACVDDTDDVPEKLPLAVREQPMEVTFKYAKALYDTLRDAAKAKTNDTFTLTDSDSSTHVGAGWVTKVGPLNLSTDGISEFTVTLTPQTTWTFTAG